MGFPLFLICLKNQKKITFFFCKHRCKLYLENFHECCDLLTFHVPVIKLRLKRQPISIELLVEWLLLLIDCVWNNQSRGKNSKMLIDNDIRTPFFSSGPKTRQKGSFTSNETFHFVLLFSSKTLAGHLNMIFSKGLHRSPTSSQTPISC